MSTETPELTQGSAQPPSLMAKLGPVAVGPRGIQFNDMDSIMRFSKAVSASQFCPNNFSDIDCFICISRGLELGLSPMASLESIYVLNKKATLYGDMPKAIVEASGLMEEYSQSFQGLEFDDDFQAVVTSKRKGRVPMTESFSVGDAKAAELWGKKGPWTNYPKRMLLFRARGYNLRDNFGDVLRNMQIGELVDDFDGARQVSGRVVEPKFIDSPKPAPFSTTSRAAPETIEAEQRRHRRTKAEMEAARASEAAALTAQKSDEDKKDLESLPKAPPARAETPSAVSTLPEPQNAPDANSASPQAVTSPIAADEIRNRLAAEGIHQETFLNLLVSLDLIETEQADISAGYYTIGHVPVKTIELALKDWAVVLSHLKKG